MQIITVTKEQPEENKKSELILMRCTTASI